LCVCHRSYAGARKKDDNKIFCACSAASVDFLKMVLKSVFYERMSEARERMKMAFCSKKTCYRQAGKF